MLCEYFRCTMRSDLCLEYQARARGQSKNTNSWTQRKAMIEQWEIKYKPCLTCAQGKEISKNGGKDKDVENLKRNHINVGAEQTKLCPRCNRHLPKSSFGPHSGNKDGLQCYCRECQRIIQAESYQRSKGKNVTPDVTNVTANVTPGCQKSIDQIAPNKAPESIAEQSIKENMNDNKQVVSTESKPIVDIPSNIKCQICKGTYPAANDFHNEPNICDMCWESNQQMNTPVPPPAPEEIPPGGKTEIKEKPILRTCTRCGFVGPEKSFHKAGINGHIDVCRKCIVKKRKANQEQRDKNTVELGPQDILLSFVDLPEVFENLVASAKRNFRTVNNEILFRLVNHAG